MTKKPNSTENGEGRGPGDELLKKMLKTPPKPNKDKPNPNPEKECAPDQ